MDLGPAGAAHRAWRVLQVGWSGGANFLAALEEWRADPHRSDLLHYVAVDAAFPDDARWPGLTPGFHRFSYENGLVLLTLCVGERAAMLREQMFRADAIVLDELPQPTLKALPRLCRRGTTLACDGRVDVSENELAGLGFVVEGRTPLRARYTPRWQVKGLPDGEPAVPQEAIVIGAGLAGAAVAASLARRGCNVQVLDAGDAPATGASALPAGLMAPHQSPDDNLLSRLSRAGVRITWQACARLLQENVDWAPIGVLEHRRGDRRAVPPLGAALEPWTREATPSEKLAAGTAVDESAWWHATAGWVRPSALVRAWLAEPRIRFRGGCEVRDIVRDGNAWSVRDAGGSVLGRGDMVVVAAAGGTARLFDGRVAVHPVRGQVSWRHTEPDDALPPTPVNGNGHFIPDVPTPAGRIWLTGSTYGRADVDARPRPEDQAVNLERLRELLPRTAASLAPHFDDGSARAWSGVRWTSSDRRPLAGQIEPGLWVSTAMGSRGLTFAGLCAEWIAARVFGEPWPVEARLAQAIDVARSSSSRT